MKQIIVAVALLLSSFSLAAQDVKKARNFFDKKDWVKAKEAIDLTLANEKDQKNWEAWFYKGLIYGQIANDPALKSTITNGWVQSFEAYKKAMELDSTQTNLFIMTRQYPVFNNYQELQKEANEAYNGKDYNAALEKYKQADMVGRFIYKNSWALTAVDTVLYYYAGAAAMQIDKMDEAISFFQKICDANIGGEGYDVCYRYVSYHYDQKGDAATSEKYSALGRKLYPNDTYYDKLDLDKQRKKGVGPDLFAQYEKVINKEPKDYDIRYDYAAEMFNWLYTDQKAPADQKQTYFQKIADQLKKCSEINAASPESYLLLGKTYFNEAAAISEEVKAIKGNAPADTQKKTELKKKMEERMKEAIPHLETAMANFEKMTAEELKAKRMKSEYKTTLYLLTEANRFLGNTEKEKMYDKKYQALNQ
jgi:hypothetical protein